MVLGIVLVSVVTGLSILCDDYATAASLSALQQQFLRHWLMTQHNSYNNNNNNNSASQLSQLAWQPPSNQVFYLLNLLFNKSSSVYLVYLYCILSLLAIGGVTVYFI